MGRGIFELRTSPCSLPDWLRCWELSTSELSKHFMGLETQGLHSAPAKLGSTWVCHSLDGCSVQHRAMNTTQVLTSCEDPTQFNLLRTSSFPLPHNRQARGRGGDSSPRGWHLFLAAKGPFLRCSGKSRLEGCSLHHQPVSSGSAGRLALTVSARWLACQESPTAPHPAYPGMGWASPTAFLLSSISPGYLDSLGRQPSPRLARSVPSPELVLWGLA